MTQSKWLAYILLLTCVGLALIHVIAELIRSSHFLNSIPLFAQVEGLTTASLHLASITGCMAGGLYIVLAERHDGCLRHEREARYVVYAWLGVVGLILVFVTLGWQVSVIFAWIMLILVASLSVLILRSVQNWSAIQTVWTAGIGLYCVCLVSVSPDRVILGVQQNIAFILMMAALGFWLMHRLSNITPQWAEASVLNIAGIMTAAGITLTASPFYSETDLRWVRGIALAGIMVLPMVAILYAAHCYRALWDRNPTRTLVAHWLTLSLILYLLGAGLLGTIFALPNVNHWVQATHLVDVQSRFLSLAVLMMLFGIINQAVAEMRHENRRVTGLIPFWLVGGGVMGSGLALAGAGLVQVYLGGLLNMNPIQTRPLLEPLYQGWVFGNGLSVLGVFTYVLGLAIRRVIQ